MTTLTNEQREALVAAKDALWDKATFANTDEEADEAYYVVNDLLDNATIEAAAESERKF